jgi:hypothetical protein
MTSSKKLYRLFLLFAFLCGLLVACMVNSPIDTTRVANHLTSTTSGRRALRSPIGDAVPKIGDAVPKMGIWAPIYF